MTEKCGSALAVLPSVLRDHDVFGVGKEKEPYVIQLDFADLPTGEVCAPG